MTDLREVARSCFRAALRAVEPQRLVHFALEKVELGSDICLVAIGKAASGMAAGAMSGLGDRVRDGLVVVPRGSIEGEFPDHVEVIVAGHPLPDQASVYAARRLMQMVGRSSESLLLLLSGGASALVCRPSGGLTRDDVVSTTQLLYRSGASIHELNTVRKHIEELKGGRLAKLTGAQRTVALVLSDVVDDRLDVIASGPVVADVTSFSDAIEVLRARRLWDRVPAAVREHLVDGDRGRVAESPAPGDPCFERVECRIVGGNRIAQEAALAEAESAGFRGLRLERPLTGEARQAGRDLAQQALRTRAGRDAEGPSCLVAGGETTVTVVGEGLGGRNQELALAAAVEIEGSEDLLIASFGTDGTDGPTNAAGAWVDGQTVARARAIGLDATRALEDNDSNTVLLALDELIVTGPTGTNVMDLALVLATPPGSG